MRFIKVMKMSQDRLPELGICILTLNSEVTIGYVLNFLLNQDYPKDKVRYLLVDGGSSDTTLKIAREVFNKHPGVRSEVLVGTGTNIPQARNMCLGNLLKKGVDYILFVDSDVIVTATNALELITYLSREKTNSLIHFGASPKNFKNAEDLRSFVNELKPSRISIDAEDLVQSLRIGMGFTLIPRELALSQRFEEDLDTGEDFYYAFEALGKGYASYATGRTAEYIHDVNIRGLRSDLYWRMPFKRYLRSMRKKTLRRLISYVEDVTLKPSRGELLKGVTKHALNALLLATLCSLPVLAIINTWLFTAIALIRLSSMLGYATCKRLQGYPLLDGLKNRIKFELYSTLMILNLPLSYQELTRALSRSPASKTCEAK